MVVLSAADHLKLAADAAAGANAAKELHLSKFTTEFNDAVGKGKVMPAMEGTFQLSYDVDPEATLKALRELPEGTIPVTARGHTGDGDDDHAARVDDTVLSAAADEKWDVDTDRAALDAKVQTLMASDNIDYGDALDRVLAGV